MNLRCKEWESDLSRILEGKLNYEQNRYWACGEYGSYGEVDSSGKTHLHVIVHYCT
jgi:hypothetical protein